MDKLLNQRATQSDIVRLIQGLDMIGNTTSFNGQKLLSGSFTNKEFQVGASQINLLKLQLVQQQVIKSGK